jgi:hypothetical protein
MHKPSKPWHWVKRSVGEKEARALFAAKKSIVISTLTTSIAARRIL